MNMADKVLEKIDEKKNPCVVGLDPVVEKIPEHLLKGDTFEDVANAFREFNYAIIDSVYDLVPCVKPQVAFYEKYGSVGLQAFKDTVDYAHSKGLIVIEDGKRNDITTTAQAYADGHLGKAKTKESELASLDVDLLTVSPYLGSDGLTPFVDVCKKYNKGVFILAKTSNPGSGEWQDRLIDLTNEEQQELRAIGIKLEKQRTTLYNLVALRINKYAQECKGKSGYSSIGAVVGAQFPAQAITLRKIMSNSIFLVPGYGAQGGTANELVNCFNEDGYGAVVNSSRGIIYSYGKTDDAKNFAGCARKSTQLMIADICGALKNKGKYNH